MKIETIIHELHTRHEFRIARSRRDAVTNVFLRVQADGITGWGEAAPSSFYNEKADAVCQSIAQAAEFLSTLKLQSIADIERAWEETWSWVAPSRAAQCAIDLALWDWFAIREGTTVAELVTGKAPRSVPTFCTIGLSTPEELAEKARELAAFPLIKLKSDQSADLLPVRYIRERSTAKIAVDANCAWSAVDLRAAAKELSALGVAFLEQPFAPHEDHRLPRTPTMPLMADESCVSEADVERVARHFDGFNIKLVKCGGLTPALRMARRGRELGLKTMVGCMLESSLLIAAGAVVAQRTEFADLDGAWLLADDPFAAWRFDRGVLSPPTRVGFGAKPVSRIGGPPVR